MSHHEERMAIALRMLIFLSTPNVYTARESAFSHPDTIQFSKGMFMFFVFTLVRLFFFDASTHLNVQVLACTSALLREPPDLTVLKYLVRDTHTAIAITLVQLFQGNALLTSAGHPSADLHCILVSEAARTWLDWSQDGAPGNSIHVHSC